MATYQNLVQDVLRNGFDQPDRTGTGCRKLFGKQLSFHVARYGDNYSIHLPLDTTRKINTKFLFDELIWFISGSTNVNDLPPDSRKLWQAWAREDGSLGPLYGHQLRHLKVDQLQEALRLLREDPNSRRNVMTTWNPEQLSEMALAPCHGTVIQLHTHTVGLRTYLSMTTFQRSADLLVGVPYNIASYAALLQILARLAGMHAYQLSYMFGDVHIYSNHFEAAETILTRIPYESPILHLSPDIMWDTPLEEIKASHFEIQDYQHHPHIKLPVAV